MQGLSEESIQGFDIALFSAGGSTSGEWAPRFAAAGATVIDNSSRWRDERRRAARRQRGQPRGARRPTAGIIANPNCSTMQMVVALKPIHDAAGIERAGHQHLPGRFRHRQGAVDELLDQSHALLHEGDMPPRRAVRPPDRLQRAPPRRQLRARRRPHRRGAQADQRDAQDPRRPVDPRQRRPACACPSSTATPRPSTSRRATSSTPERARELPRRRARRHRPRRRPVARRSTRMAIDATGNDDGVRRARSAGIRATSARSTCGSSPTTCARARPPTPSSSPSCSTSAERSAAHGDPVAA